MKEPIEKQTYSNILPKEERERRAAEVKSNYEAMLNSGKCEEDSSDSKGKWILISLVGIILIMGCFLGIKFFF
ncbi:MAG: hypothetical protein RSA90_03995 [Lachnospiraceae bacterium]